MSWSTKRKRLLAKFRKLRKDGLLYCTYCNRGPLYVGKSKGRPIENRATVDHVIARDAGGSDDISNCVVSCVVCNTKKETKPVEQFLAELVQVTH